MIIPFSYNLGQAQQSVRPNRVERLELDAGPGCWSFFRQFKVLLHVVENHVKM